MRQGIEVRIKGNVVSIERIKKVGKGRDAQHVLNFRMASNHYAPAGTPQEEVGASFVNVSIWNQRAITLAQYARKGMPLGITGWLELKQVPSTKAEGVMVTFADVRATDFEFINSGRRQQGDDEQAEQAAPQAAPAAEEQVEAAPATTRTSKRAGRSTSPRRSGGKSKTAGGASDVPVEVLANESTGGGEAAPSDEKPF